MTLLPPRTRHYPVRNLDFRDFWDICSSIQRMLTDYSFVSYTIDGRNSPIVLDESDVSVILRALAQHPESPRLMLARLFRSPEEKGSDQGTLEIIYRAAGTESEPPGLIIPIGEISKIDLFRLEDAILGERPQPALMAPKIEFGTPCEVVSVVIDMRGFSTFCEQPNIESPYTCGLMSAFYHLVEAGFSRYPPELIKFLGDGVLAIWETTPADREIAIQTCLWGCVHLDSQWKVVRQNPHFSHGAPESIGAGISFGLASRLTIDNDYLGRPINLAARLCGVCPGGRLLVDRAVPALPFDLEKKPTRVRIKSFGEYNVWSILGE